MHHEREIEQHSKEDSYLIQRFYLQLLSYNQSLTGEEQGERATGKDTMKTVMSDNNSQREKFTVLSVIQSVIQSAFNDQRPLRCNGN